MTSADYTLGDRIPADRATDAAWFDPRADGISDYERAMRRATEERIGEDVARRTEAAARSYRDDDPADSARDALRALGIVR